MHQLNGNDAHSKYINSAATGGTTYWKVWIPVVHPTWITNIGVYANRGTNCVGGYGSHGMGLARLSVGCTKKLIVQSQIDLKLSKFRTKWLVWLFWDEN